MAARFRVVRSIARGGMAEVWLAEREDGTRVALKRALPDFAADPRFRRMFLDEVRIASALDHPGIVRVLESGEDEGVPWIAMELVEGADASRLAARGRRRGSPLPEVAALRIGVEVARALHAAHEARDAEGTPLNVVHRDVSPGNVLVARDGTVKLADFGIAKARDRLERTSAGIMKGKMAYMPPEQMLGGELDRRTDVFGLGCSLHALLAGRSPLTDEHAVASLMAGEALVLSDALAEDVRVVLARALAPSRFKRFATAAALADAFEALLEARGDDGREALCAWAHENMPPVGTDPEAATRAGPRSRGADDADGSEGGVSAHVEHDAHEQAGVAGGGRGGVRSVATPAPVDSSPRQAPVAAVTALDEANVEAEPAEESSGAPSSALGDAADVDQGSASRPGRLLVAGGLGLLSLAGAIGVWTVARSGDPDPPARPAPMAVASAPSGQPEPAPQQIDAGVRGAVLGAPDAGAESPVAEVPVAEVPGRWRRCRHCVHEEAVLTALARRRLLRRRRAPPPAASSATSWSAARQPRAGWCWSTASGEASRRSPSRFRPASTRWRCAAPKGPPRLGGGSPSARSTRAARPSVGSSTELSDPTLAAPRVRGSRSPARARCSGCRFRRRAPSRCPSR